MARINNIPETYAEYAAENYFAEEELGDKIAEKYYNKVAELINQFTLIEPSEFEDTNIKDDVLGGDWKGLLELYVNKKCVDKATADELYALFEDEIFSLGPEYGFLWDIVIETFLQI